MREPSHPNFGTQARVEVDGCEVRLIFTASDEEKADAFAEDIIDQLKRGDLNIRMRGRPTRIVEQ